MGTKGKLGSELEKLRADIAEAEAEAKTPKKRAADVARKSGEAAKRKSVAEIDGVSETTMQEFLEETRKVRSLLESGKITPGKAQTLFERISNSIGLGEDEEEPEAEDDEDPEDEDPEDDDR